jgi:hypothetical protein
MNLRLSLRALRTRAGALGGYIIFPYRQARREEDGFNH